MTKTDVNLICHVILAMVNELPTVLTPKDGWKFPNELISQMADLIFCESRPIDLLIGSGIFVYKIVS